MSRHQGKLFAGIDWASKTHAICVVDDTGAIIVRFEIPNTGKTFNGLVKRLTKLGVEGVAIERCDGPLVEALLEAGLRVLVITPRQVKGLRSRYTGSGAKSDFADDSRHASPWAAKVYNDAIARGKRHPHAVRILARAWVRVIWRCWQDRLAYDPQLHGGAMQLAA